MNAQSQTVVATGHDELLDAVQRLEFALAAPAPRRERDWCERVTNELGQLRTTFLRHVAAAETPGRLYA